jgi:RNA polymerase primary sigma factor
VEWVTKYLDDVFHKKMVITHRKDLCQGDYLIDDRGKNGTSEFGGEWIHFGSEMFLNWNDVLDYLLPAEKKPGLDEILEEIGRSSLLTHEEELALLKAVQKKGTDCDEMKQLEKGNMRFIVSVANQYQKQGLTLEELIEAGNEGLRKAAIKYDASRGFKFIAYAVWWIRQSILQAIEEKNNE